MKPLSFPETRDFAQDGAVAARMPICLLTEEQDRFLVKETRIQRDSRYPSKI